MTVASSSDFRATSERDGRDCRAVASLQISGHPARKSLGPLLFISRFPWPPQRHTRARSTDGCAGFKSKKQKNIPPHFPTVISTKCARGPEQNWESDDWIIGRSASQIPWRLDRTRIYLIWVRARTVHVHVGTWLLRYIPFQYIWFWYMTCSIQSRCND